MSMNSIDLSGLDNLKPDEYKELTSDPLKLAGIWESSPEGTKMYNQQKEHAQKNLELVQACEDKMKTNAELRKELVEANKTLERRYYEWQTAEAEMHSAFEPYTESAIKKRLQLAIEDNEDVFEMLVSHWRADDSPTTVIDELLTVSFERHLRKLKLESLAGA